MSLFSTEEPLPPWQRHSPTSKAASLSVRQSVAAQREFVFRVISESPNGLTDEEVQRATGLVGNSERPRRVELMNTKPPRIYEAGKRKTSSGRMAVVWKAIGSDPF